MKHKCAKCGSETESYSAYRECDDCKRKRQDEDCEASRRLMNQALGDMLNTGIPGGIDMDISTPL